MSNPTHEHRRHTAQVRNPTRQESRPSPSHGARGNAVWLAEARDLAGYPHADGDGREELQAKLQAFVDNMIAEAMKP